MAVIPQPEQCGHCGESKNVQTQNHAYLCLDCGKWSNLDGTPVVGNHHARANYSKTFPEANSHGIAEFRKD